MTNRFWRSLALLLLLGAALTANACATADVVARSKEHSDSGGDFAASPATSSPALDLEIQAP
jgi:hypothetical protein